MFRASELRIHFLVQARENEREEEGDRRFLNYSSLFLASLLALFAYEGKGFKPRARLPFLMTCYRFLRESESGCEDKKGSIGLLP